MASGSKNTPPLQAIALYDKLLEASGNIERKGATMPYTAVNGNMFSFLGKDGTLALRLPAEAREIFIKKYKTALSEQHGIVMKEYVSVPGKLLQNTKELSGWFAESYAYALTLKARPAKK